MPHICIQRLSTSQCQNYRSHDYKQVPSTRLHEFDSSEWIERRQDSRILDNLRHAGTGKDREPDDNNRAKQLADDSGSIALPQKQSNDHCNGNGQHIGFECGGHSLQPLHGAQD